MERAAALGERIWVSTLGTPEETIGLVAGAAPEELDAEVETAASIYADFRRDGLRDAALGSLAEWLGGDGAGLVGHDLKEVLRWLPEAGSGELRVAAELTDVMLLSYLIRPAVHAHGFEEMALERLGRRALTEKDAGWSKEGPPAVGDSRIAALAGERVVLGRRLAASVAAEMAGVECGEALSEVYRDIEAPLLPVLLAMEERGVRLDCEFLAAMSEELGAEIEELEGKIYDVAGEEFNVGSPQQLGVILFEKLEYPVIKRTRKTKSYATGADVLEELAGRGYELPVLILRYRELTKLKSTYIDALPTLVAEDGRLHTTFHQAVAATGRLSSANPNLQNIPVRTELGQRIRKAFVADPGHSAAWRRTTARWSCGSWPTSPRSRR